MRHLQMAVKWVTSLIGGNELATAAMTVASCLLIIVFTACSIESGENK